METPLIISSEEDGTHYQSFESAVKLVARVVSKAFMTKADFTSAFWNVPRRFQDLNILDIKVPGRFFIDCCPQLVVSISCAIFSTVIY